MKAIELNIDELGELTKAIEKLMKAEYIGGVEKDVADELDGADGLMFLAGWHLGALVAASNARNHDASVELSLFAYETAKNILSENPGIEFDDSVDKLLEALTEKMKGDIEECDCPACRADREAEGE